MLECAQFEVTAMQRKTVRQRQMLVPVEKIAGHGAADGAQMHAYLVRPACIQSQAQ